MITLVYIVWMILVHVFLNFFFFFVEYQLSRKVDTVYGFQFKYWRYTKYGEQCIWTSVGIYVQLTGGSRLHVQVLGVMEVYIVQSSVK